MSNPPSEVIPAREFYTAQELADLALEWGASATVVSDDGRVAVELERGSEVLQLDLGRASEFYGEVLCRGWVKVPSAPHRACDRWNEYPYFGSFSLVYDENDLPRHDADGFVVRGVSLVEFGHCRSRSEVMTRILFFWFGLTLIQALVASGSTDLTEIDQAQVQTDLVEWWFGRDVTGDGEDDG